MSNLWMAKSVEPQEYITWPRGDTKFLFECISQVRTARVKYFTTWWEISYLQVAMLYSINYINTSEKTNLLTFVLRGAIPYVTVAKVVSSRVKISCCLHVWRYWVFMWKLTRYMYFISVYIINIYLHWYETCWPNTVKVYVNGKCIIENYWSTDHMNREQFNWF